MQKIFGAIMFALLFLVGCGDSTHSNTTATLKISLSGTLPANTAIAGAEFTLTLPADVTPATVNGIIDSSVVTPSGLFSGGILASLYTPATTTSAGTVKTAIINANTSGATQTGEVATMVLQLANGAEPTAASFTLASASVSVIDIRGNPISGLQAVVSEVQLQ